MLVVTYTAQNNQGSKVSVVCHVNIREQRVKGAKFLERAKFHVRGQSSVGYYVHKSNVILQLFERVKIMIALIHLCFGGDSPLSYVKT